MKGTIVFEGVSKKGTPIIILYLRENDVRAMQEYINMLSKEETFIRFQGEQTSQEGEEKYVKSELEKIANKKSVQLLVWSGEKLIGISGIGMQDKTEQHIGVFGISIAKEYRGEGIGRLLMKQVLEEAKKHLVGLEIVTLGVFETNDLAKSMYTKFGFIEYGRLPKGVYRKNGREDHIEMYLNVSH